MELSLAQQLASEVKDLLYSSSGKIEIAGGVRREKPQPHDLEIVCQPTYEQVFGHLNSVDRRMHELVSLGKIQLGDPFVQVRKDPETGKEREIWCKAPFSEKYYRVKYKGEKVDVFVCTPPAEWGVELTLRTGDGGHNIWLVKQGWLRGIFFREGHLVQHVDDQGRYIPMGAKVKEGQKTYGKVLSTPEERNVFDVLRIPWKDPKDRGTQTRPAYIPTTTSTATVLCAATRPGSSARSWGAGAAR